MPDNDMGNPKNITEKTFREAAVAAGQKPDEAKKNVMELLQKMFAGKNSPVSESNTGESKQDLTA